MQQSTIFLDESVNDAATQRNSRVLQSGTFERVGGNQPIKVTVRVIAATNKPLEAAVAANNSRDYFTRLNVVRIPMPIARARRRRSAARELFFEKNAREQQRPPNPSAASVIKTLENIIGRATCANWRMPSAARTSWPRAMRFWWAICRRKFPAKARRSRRRSYGTKCVK